ncbi:MAG TPA: hypothetical protein VFD82_20425 [Planctomycetota bacterium]|nr:hypothetical protein [Planctomycetota bacterium]
MGSPSLVEQMVGCFDLEGVITHWTDERIGAAGPRDRRALAEAVRTLDARTSPVPPWLGVEAALVAAGEDPAAVLPIPGWQACLWAWRSGFSSRRMMFGAIAETMTSLADVSVEPDEAWPARTARLSAIGRRLQGSANPAMRMMTIGVHGIERRKTLCRCASCAWPWLGTRARRCRRCRIRSNAPRCASSRTERRPSSRVRTRTAICAARRRGPDPTPSTNALTATIGVC